MRNLELIYNSNSGNRTFKNDLDTCIQIFQDAGYSVSIFRIDNKCRVDDYLKKLNPLEHCTIVVAGGDGTVNIVLNSILKNKIKCKLGIIPAGTANDFATSLNIPKSNIDAAKVIVNGKTINSDVGKVNDYYFINVFGAGLLTNISQHVDNKLKNTLGKIAYYLKGIEKFPKFESIKLRISNSNKVIEEEILFLIVLNSPGAGGFEKLVPEAKMDDGLFEFIGIKSIPVQNMIKLFLKVLTGDYLNDDNVVYFRDSYIKIENCVDNINSKDMNIETDIDGEFGPNLPVEIENIPNAIEVFTNN